MSQITNPAVIRGLQVCFASEFGRFKSDNLEHLKRIRAVGLPQRVAISVRIDGKIAGEAVLDTGASPFPIMLTPHWWNLISANYAGRSEGIKVSLFDSRGHFSAVRLPTKSDIIIGGKYQIKDTVYGTNDRIPNDIEQKYIGTVGAEMFEKGILLVDLTRKPSIAFSAPRLR